MIKINNIQYEDYQIKVIWENFSVSSKENRKRTGKAPSIIFNVCNNIAIEIEFTFSKNMFLKTSVSKKTNIKNYVSDIIIKSCDEYSSIISGKCDCNIIRINEKTFNFDIFIEDYEISIFINTNVDLF